MDSRALTRRDQVLAPGWEAERDALLRQAERPQTRRALRGAVEHFERVFGGRLPASPAMMEQYVLWAKDRYSVATITQRLAMLAAWHHEHYFPDPTKTPEIKALKRALRQGYNRAPKQAKAFDIARLHRAVAVLDAEIATAAAIEDPRASRKRALTAIRDKCLLVVGFWFGFRSDELVRLDFANITIDRHAQPRTMNLWLSHTKGDREAEGSGWHITEIRDHPCPVNAMLDWQAALMVEAGPVFTRIDRWGRPATTPMHINSVNKWLLGLLERVGMDAEERDGFSSHSLRRGLANWLAQQDAETREIMDWIQWRDPRSPRAYIRSQQDLPNRLIERKGRSGGRRISA